MKRPSNRVLALGAAVVAVAAGGSAAIAASEGSSPSPSSFFQSLAEHLGISTQKLQDATKAAAKDQVDAALKEGTITKAEADALKARIDAANYPFLGLRFLGRPSFFPGRPFLFRGPRLFTDRLSAAADYLGLSVSQLRQRLSAGQSLADLAKAQGKSVDGLKKAILDAVEKKLDAAVKAGKLTADEEKDLLADFRARIDDFVDRTPPAGGIFFRRHFERDFGLGFGPRWRAFAPPRFPAPPPFP